MNAGGVLDYLAPTWTPTESRPWHQRSLADAFSSDDAGMAGPT
jgi:hypothetical protein